MKHWKGIVFAIGMTTLVTGCGKRDQQMEALAAYTEEMSAFCDEMAQGQAQLNALDMKEDTAQEEMLSILDGMAETAAEAANADVPEGYEEAGELCKRASDYLQEAKGEYHAAFDSESVDQTALDDGNTAYRSAGRSISLMLTALGRD